MLPWIEMWRAALRAAYIVFEDLPLTNYGNRLPQLSFEVVRAGQTDTNSLRDLVQGVNIIPASGEFVYGTQIVRERRFPGIEKPLNMNNGDGRADFVLSLEQLQSDFPEVRSAALTVAWFGDSVDAGVCRIKPGVETRDRETVPYGWTVDDIGRQSAHLISQSDTGANYGGTPADACVIEGIQALKTNGVQVTLSPFLLMDAPGFPWRGRITVSVDKTAAARTEIDAFVGTDGGFGFRHFILHHARLAAEAGGVDAFLIGSEMVGLTRVRDETGAFPFVEALVELALEVRAILGPATHVSYAADWTEYGAYVPADGSDDVLFPLDPLWASPHVDFVGVDYYAPLGDWRDGDDHTDALAGYASADEAAYLQANMVGGEAYDWYYASQADRDAQIRTPISDTAHGEDWVFRQKDLIGWWQANHFERPGGVRSPVSTAWSAEQKPLRLIEIGYPAVDRGGNAPNVFYDPKSTESAFPPYSNGARDDLYQKRALTEALSFWPSQAGVEEVLVWAWDARPWPHFPAREDIWSDGDNWQFGHWLNGRSGLIELSEVIADLFDAAGAISVDTSSLNGFVEGYSFDGVTTLRSGLAPLQTAFGLICREQAGYLRLLHAEGGDLSDISEDLMIADSLQLTQMLLDKTPGRLVMSYIDGSGDYTPATIEARTETGDPNYSIQMTMPLVLSLGYASFVADTLLKQTESATSASYSAGPVDLVIEAGDRVNLNGHVWQILEITDNDLRRDFLMRPDTSSFLTSRSGGVVYPGALAPVYAEPEFVLIDGPRLENLDTPAPIIAVSGEPWRGGVMVSAGPEDTSLTERAVISSPASIGRLRRDLPEGPVGRWDEAAELDIEMIGADLASLTKLSVLNGRGQILVQGHAGWELLAYRSAALIEPDRWRLTGLLRGLNGSSHSGASVGAVAVLVDDNLIQPDFREAETGLSLRWQAGEAESKDFGFEDLGGLPWPVAHLKAVASATGWMISWTRRGADIADSWVYPEADNTGTFWCEILQNGTIIQSFTVMDGVLLFDGAGDEVRVSEVGADARMGKWASIPLIAA